MSPSCRDFDRLSDERGGASPRERELWRRHLEGCERCRRQLAADQLLRRGLGAAPGVELSAAFDAELRRRLAARRSRRRLGWGARLVLAAYATAAALLAVWVLAGVDWSVASTGAGGVVLGFIAALFPLLLLHPTSPLAPRGWP